jgi:hypothetical protein
VRDCPACGRNDFWASPTEFGRERAERQRYERYAAECRANGRPEDQARIKELESQVWELRGQIRRWISEGRWKGELSPS